MVHLLKVLQMVNDKENLRRRHLDVVRLHQFLCRELQLDALDALRNRDELLRDDYLT